MVTAENKRMKAIKKFSRIKSPFIIINVVDGKKSLWLNWKKSYTFHEEVYNRINVMYKYNIQVFCILGNFS